MSWLLLQHANAVWQYRRVMIAGYSVGYSVDSLAGNRLADIVVGRAADSFVVEDIGFAEAAACSELPA